VSYIVYAQLVTIESRNIRSYGTPEALLSSSVTGGASRSGVVNVASRVTGPVAQSYGTPEALLSSSVIGSGVSRSGVTNVASRVAPLAVELDRSLASSSIWTMVWQP